MKIVISAESTIDLPKELLEEFDIHTIPYTVIMGGKDYLDGVVSCDDIFTFVSGSGELPKTSAINKYQYEEYFKSLLKDYDAVIHFTLSSLMSSASSNASDAAKELKNVYVIDSKSLSTGIALLAIKASNLAKNNTPIDKILEIINNTVDRVQASFILDKLQYLYKGGRCSALSMFGANLFSIKPQILVKNGKMGVGKKYMGNLDVATKRYCEDTLNAFGDYEKEYAFVTYTTASENMIKTAKESLEKRGFKTIFITRAGATIASHCGPNTLGVLFISK